MCLCVCVYIYIYVCIYICVCVYIYIYLSALQQTLTVSFSRESFLFVSTLFSNIYGMAAASFGGLEEEKVITVPA